MGTKIVLRPFYSFSSKRPIKTFLLLFSSARFIEFKRAIRDLVCTKLPQNLFSFWRESKLQKCKAYVGRSLTKLLDSAQMTELFSAFQNFFLLTIYCINQNGYHFFGHIFYPKAEIQISYPNTRKYLTKNCSFFSQSQESLNEENLSMCYLNL